MRTEELIVSLAQSATPVRVLRPVPVRLAQWTALAVAIAAVVVFAVGPRADFLAALGQLRYVLAAAAVLATAILSAAAAFVLNVPGGERSSMQRLLPLITGALWATLLIIWLREGGHAWSRIAALPIHLLCVVLIVILATISGGVLMKMLARGASLHPLWSGVLASLAAAAVGALAAQIVCPIDDAAHHLTGHFAPFLLAASTGALVPWQSLQPWRHELRRLQ